MLAYLLVIIVNLPNGGRQISMEKFDNAEQCYAAMQIVVREVPGVTASCNELVSP